MCAKRHISIAVFSATILFFVCWQTTAAKPLKKQGNPGVPGLLAEISRLQFIIDQQAAELEELEDMLYQCQTLANVPQTGQIQSHTTGDDGDMQTGVQWPNPRFTDNGDGTVTDNLTGLMWLRDAIRDCFETMAWQDALNKVTDFNVNPAAFSCKEYTAFYNDWRMPTLKEMQSLVHCGCNMPFLPNTDGTACWDSETFFGVRVDHYWTGTTSNRDSGAAWTLNFTHSQGMPYDKTYADRASVWPVRSGYKLDASFHQPTQGPLEPDISVNPPAKDFGNVPLFSTSSQTFTITNIGSGDLL